MITKEDIEKCIEEGKETVSSLAKHFNVTVPTIRYYLKKYSLFDIVKKRKKINEEEIRKLIEEGKSIKEISEIFNVSKPTVRYYIEKFNMRDYYKKKEKKKIKIKTPVTIAVLSCKGGVGKTIISCHLAKNLSQEYRVRLIDCDITGPDVPITLGNEEIRPVIENGKLKANKDGNIEYFSIACLNPSAVLWDGLRIKNIILQIMNDIEWENKEITIFDIAAGTRDELQVISSIVDKAIVVCEPRKISVYDAKKAIEACKFYKIDVLGIVLNKTKIKCGEKEIYLGDIEKEEIKKELKEKIIVEIPYLEKNEIDNLWNSEYIMKIRGVLS